MINSLELACTDGVLPTIDQYMNILKITLFAFFLTLLVAGTAQASGTNCTVMYGGYAGSESCAKISVDKKVLRPGTKDYVDGLSAIDAKYRVSQEVTFQLVVKNDGPEKLTNVVVTDTLPQFVSFVSGPGSYDKNANKLTFVVASLESGKSETIYIKTKVADNVTFPNNGFTCVTNYVRVTEKSGISAEDSSQFCIEQPQKVYPPVLGVKQTPPTGPEAAALPALLGIAGAGMYLRKKVRV